MSETPSLVVMITSSGMGQGEPDLGEKLLDSFFRMLLENGARPLKLIFVNSGIFLTTEGSPLIDSIRQFERQGTEILSCGTCLNYYDRSERLIAGAATDMRNIVNALLQADKVLQI